MPAFTRRTVKLWEDGKFIRVVESTEELEKIAKDAMKRKLRMNEQSYTETTGIHLYSYGKNTKPKEWQSLIKILTLVACEVCN